MDAQGLGRTHPLTPTRRLKQHTHAYNPPLTPTRRLKQHTHAYNPRRTGSADAAGRAGRRG